METMQNINEQTKSMREKRAEQVAAALAKNSKISAISPNLSKRIAGFYMMFPEISLDNLCQRLETVEITDGSRFAYSDPMQYLPRENKIVINGHLINEDTPVATIEHETMKTILAMITAKDNSFGFGGDERLAALNMGYLESFARLFGGDDEWHYEDEMTLYNFIYPAMGSSVFEAFFHNNHELLMEQLLRNCQTPEKLNAWLSKMNYNMHTRRVPGRKKLFSELQIEAAGMFPVEMDFLAPGVELPQTLENTKTI